MALSIFFVRADSVDGDNQDLLVRAQYKEDCLAIWREYFELDEDAEPMWVGQVPGAVATVDLPGAIPWAGIIPE